MLSGNWPCIYEHSRRRSNLPLSPRFTIKPSRNPVSLGHSSSLLATCDMGDQSVWGHFRPPFESALQAYEMKTGVTLSKHPLVLQLQEYHTVDSITTVLQDQARNFGDFQQNDRITKRSRVPSRSSLPSPPLLPLASLWVRYVNSLIVHSTSDTSCSRSHPRNQYRLVLLSYLLYVISFLPPWVFS